MYVYSVGVLGSHSYLHLSAVRACVAALAPYAGVRILTRGLGAVDHVVMVEAKRCGIPIWVVCDDARDPTPEHTVVAGADALHVFWDGRSAGTLHVINLALLTGTPIQVHGCVA